MAYDELPPKSVEHVFTTGDRVRQLKAIRTHCRSIAVLLSEHGEGGEAPPFRMRADHAEQLLTMGFARSDVNDVGSQFPAGPWWLNPKATDFDAPLEPWQDEVARLHAEATEVAQNLRAIGTLGWS